MQAGAMQGLRLQSPAQDGITGSDEGTALQETVSCALGGSDSPGEKFPLWKPLLLGRARFVLFIIHLLGFGGMPRFLQFSVCGCVIY